MEARVIACFGLLAPWMVGWMVGSVLPLREFGVRVCACVLGEVLGSVCFGAVRNSGFCSWVVGGANPDPKFLRRAWAFAE